MSPSNPPDKKRVLGRGLAALLNEKEANTSTLIGNILEIPLEKIFLNPNQPRVYFDEKSLKELAESISSLGIIQPITVRKQINSYELISGERRYQACKELGMKSIPAFVRVVGDKEMLQMALVENIQREELSPIEIALCYKKLIEEISLTQEELSLKLGKSRSSITNQIRLLKLPAIIQADIQKGLISLGHGRALLALKDAEDQINLHKKIIQKALSVRQVENLIKNKDKEKTKNLVPTTFSFSNPYLKEVKETLKKRLGVPIEIKQTKNGKGKISISFHSKEELEKIKNTLS